MSQKSNYVRHSDPLFDLYSIIDFQPRRIRRFASGLKYAAIMLDNGQIGVCATLGLEINRGPEVLYHPDFTSIEHRILVNAWINANLNYETKVTGEGDIFELYDFSKSSKTTMIGYFEPLVNRFRETGLALRIYDRVINNEFISPHGQMRNGIEESDVIILTSTTLSNGTFEGIMNVVQSQTQVFMLGPSTPLHPVLFKYPCIRKLYGMLFEPFDEEVLNLIETDHGTRVFGKRGKKVSL